MNIIGIPYRYRNNTISTSCMAFWYVSVQSSMSLWKHRNIGIPLKHCLGHWANRNTRPFWWLWDEILFPAINIHQRLRESPIIEELRRWPSITDLIIHGTQWSRKNIKKFRVQTTKWLQTFFWLRKWHIIRAPFFSFLAISSQRLKPFCHHWTCSDHQRTSSRKFKMQTMISYLFILL